MSRANNDFTPPRRPYLFDSSDNAPAKCKTFSKVEKEAKCIKSCRTAHVFYASPNPCHYA